MNKNYFFSFFVTVSLLISSCSDDDEYTTIEDLLPIATNDTSTYELLQNVVVNVATNDTTGDEVLPSTISIIGGTDTDSNTTLDKLIVANEGVWTVHPATGAITFTPDSNLTTSPSPISYTIEDAEGNVSNPATVTITAVATAVADLSLVPYPKLSDYKFFAGEMKNQIPSLNVLPYEPASSLFTDYALKKRFVWMPPGTNATFNGENKVLELPVGSVLIKSFYYNNVVPNNTTRIIETRLMIRKSTGWIFAEYIWNDEQTEAFINTVGATTSVSWTDEAGTIKTVSEYRMPSETECLVCHKIETTKIPIGIKPQNLNTNFTFSTGSQNQLQKWIDVGYLENNMPATIASTVNYKDTSKPLVERVRSYLDINCAHCHSELGHCNYRPIKLSYSESTTSANLGICVTPDDFIAPANKIISPGNVQRSLMHLRMNSTDVSVRMPLLGRTVVHEEGVQLIKDWINSIENCN